MKAKILATLSAMKSDLIDTYQRSKMLLLAIGAAIIAFEYNRIKAAITVYMGAKEIKQATTQDATLKAQETTLNTTADALVKEANDLPSQEKPVTADWYKKK